MKATKYLFFLLFLLFGVLAFAADWNCKINLPPNPQNYPKELLLRMMYVDITNSEHQAVTVYLHGEVRRDGKLIGKGNSNKIEIPPGGKRITRSDITKIKKEWWDKEFEKLLFRLPTLPAGDYEACIFVYKAKGKKLLTKCCTGFKVFKKTKIPQLTHPVDDTVVLEKYPIFKWKPPKPAPREINYTLKIVEMSEGETKEAAIMKSAFFEKRGIKTTSFKYPVSARKFEKGKQYAWQVIGITATERYESEVWKFTFLTCEPPNPCPAAGWNIIIGSDALTHIDVNANGVLDVPPDIPTVVVPWPPPPWTSCMGTWGFMHNPPCNAKWISKNASGLETTAPETDTFLRCFDIPDSLKVIDACIEVTADDSVDIYLNGNFIGTHPFALSWTGQSQFNINPAFFVPGTDTLMFIVENTRCCYEGLLYCLHINTQTCICRTTEPEPPDEDHSVEPVPCDSFTECCVKLCKGWTTISFPIREWGAPFTTTLEDLIPHADHHSDVGRIGDIWYWMPCSWHPQYGWHDATNWLLNDISWGNFGHNQIGYVVYSNCSTEYCVSGIPVRNSRIMICKGWNLIGSVLCDTCPCCCGEAPVGIPWQEPYVRLTDSYDSIVPLNSLDGPYYMCRGWFLRGPVDIIEPFVGYWVCSQRDTLFLEMTCDSGYVSIERKPCVAETCACGEWDDVNVTWTGSAPSIWTGPCGSSLTISWVCAGTPISINSSISCIPNYCLLIYRWTITKTGGPAEPPQSGLSLPVTFTPADWGTFEIVLNATCGSTPCPPCTIEIVIRGRIDTCQCEITKFYVDGTTVEPEDSISVSSGSSKTISVAASCGSSGISFYNWTITKPDGTSENRTGSPFTYTFECFDEFSLRPSVYTISLIITCSDGTTCNSKFYVSVCGPFESSPLPPKH